MRVKVLAVLVLAGLLAGYATWVEAAKKDEPARVTVQHILIGYKKTVPNKKLDRTKQQAKLLVAELAQRARDGEEFDALVKEYTDDKYPGIYVLTNDDAPRIAGARQRKDMVARFGDVAFSIAVGEIEVARYHAGMSPYGWHIIKRLE